MTDKVKVKEPSKTFLDDITSFVSKNKYSIAIIAVLSGVCIYLYIKSNKNLNETDETDKTQNNNLNYPKEDIPPVLNENFAFPDENLTHKTLSQSKNEEIEISSTNTIEIGENESKILSIEDDISEIQADPNPVLTELFGDEPKDPQDPQDAQEAEKIEVYRSGPRKGQRKEPKKTIRRRRKAKSPSPPLVDAEDQ